MTAEAPAKLPIVVGTLVVAAVTLALAETGARRLTRGTAELETDVARAANVHVFAKNADDLPPWQPDAKHVVLIGNSHTYALPGLHPGEPLRPDPGKSLVDEIARRADPSERAQFHRLAYPNMLPFEMLVRALQLDAVGMKPDVVVIGLTWRNIARDRDLRAQARRALRDAGVAELMRATLVHEDAVAPAVVDAFDAAMRRQREVESASHDAPASDRIEDALADAVAPHIALLGKNAELRAQVYRRFAYALDSALAKGEGGPSYDVVEADLQFNLACLDALFELWQKRGVRVLVYQAPERSDLPPVCDPARQQVVMHDLFADAERRGFATLDASHVVPNELWGFEMDTPDRSHFTEEGHRLLAASIVDAAQAAHVFDALTH
jgi:hypothetical protein